MGILQNKIDFVAFAAVSYHGKPQRRSPQRQQPPH